MAVHLQHIVEADCAIAHLAPQEVRDALLARLSPQEISYTSLDSLINTCLTTLKPRGVYKLYNPAICTLPPAYTEPAIKLVGTLMVLHGQSAYERMRRATHCVLLAINLSPYPSLEILRSQLCHNPLDEEVFDTLCSLLLAHACTFLIDLISRTAPTQGLSLDDPLSPGEDDFPLDFRKQIAFYLQTEKRINVSPPSSSCNSLPTSTFFGIMGMYDTSQKNRKRACGRCKYHSSCSIRAIGMNCHGRKGSFSPRPSS